jgi:hypothetical protein
LPFICGITTPVTRNSNSRLQALPQLPEPTYTERVRLFPSAPGLRRLRHILIGWRPPFLPSKSLSVQRGFCISMFASENIWRNNIENWVPNWGDIVTLRANDTRHEPWHGPAEQAPTNGHVLVIDDYIAVADTVWHSSRLPAT